MVPGFDLRVEGCKLVVLTTPGCGQVSGELPHSEGPVAEEPQLTNKPCWGLGSIGLKRHDSKWIYLRRSIL